MVSLSITSQRQKYLVGCYLSGRPTGVHSENEISVVVIAVGGTTAGVIEGELTGVQTGN